MKALHSYIAVIFTGLFLYPVLYQPIHELRHHGHGRHLQIADDRSHPLQAGHSHDHRKSAPQGQATQGHSCRHHDHHTDEDPAPEAPVIFEIPEHCAICEYEFVSQDLPADTGIAPAAFQYAEKAASPLSADPLSSALRLSRPRGPPAA